MNNIDAWLYINLDESLERKNSIEKQLSFTKKNIRISGCLHNNTKIGCAMSHLKAVKEAKHLNLNVVAIVEDDFQFENMDILEDQLNDLFSVEFDGAELWISPNGKPYMKKLNEEKNMYRCFNTVGKVGYIIKRAVFDKVIECFEHSIECNMACDISLWTLQRASKWITIYPYIGKHEQGYSTIEKIYRNKLDGFNPLH